MPGTKFKLILAAAAAMTFNNWILAIFLNTKLFLHAGSVSELSVSNQPASIVFRAGDVMAGILFVWLAALLIKQRQDKAKYFLAFPITLAIMGLSNIIDASFPLNCSETLTSGCVVPVSISFHHFSIPSHGWSSIVIGAGYLFLPLFAYLFAKKAKLQNLIWLALTNLGITALSLISIGVALVLTGSYSEKAWGPSQEIQMIFIAALIFLFCRDIFVPPKELQSSE